MSSAFAASAPAAGPADVVAAHRLVADLFAPAPRYYWLELLLAGSAAWCAFLILTATDSLSILIALYVPAVLLWYRAAAMIHELTHQRRDEVPGFHLAWNLLIGVVWLLPSIMYEGAHAAHHKKTTYGTSADPEYLPLAGRPFAILMYLAFSFVAGPGLFLRFLVLAPLSWVLPPLRRFVIRTGSTYAINLAYVRAMSPAERHRLVRWECVVLLAWWPPVALTIAGVLLWKWFVVWYALYTGVLLINRIRMLTAHHFALDGEPTDHLGQFADSIDTPAGWWAELWAPIGMRYHALHHLFPNLPYHNMGVAYRRLVATLPPDSFYTKAAGRGLWPSLWEIFRGSRTR